MGENSNSEENRCIFLKNLAHPLMDKHWESITFREMLDERASNDEIYFYLFCRNMLFKGPQLNHHQAGFCFNHFVEYNKVETLINIVFNNFDNANVHYLKKKLEEKKKIKKNETLEIINSGFVLRIFLEYYRIERKQKFRYFFLEN